MSSVGSSGFASYSSIFVEPGWGKRTLIYSAPLRGLLLRASLHTTDRHQKAPHPAAPSQINLASLTA